MVVRGGMLVILAGILPLSASATNTERGRTWFKKCVAWLVAFILYKPAAAIVYATAFRLAGSDVFGSGDELMSAITGLVLMVLALLALPALMRFVTPMVAAMASGAGEAAPRWPRARWRRCRPARCACRVARLQRSGRRGRAIGVGPDPSGAVGSGRWSRPLGLEREQWLVARRRRCKRGRAPRLAPAPRARPRPGKSGRRRGGRWRRCGGRRRSSWRRAAGCGGRAGGRRSGRGGWAACRPRRAQGAAQGATESQTGDEGPSGSR